MKDLKLHNYILFEFLNVFYNILYINNFLRKLGKIHNISFLYINLNFLFYYLQNQEHIYHYNIYFFYLRDQYYIYQYIFYILFQLNNHLM